MDGKVKSMQAGDPGVMMREYLVNFAVMRRVRYWNVYEDVYGGLL